MMLFIEVPKLQCSWNISFDFNFKISC